MKLLQAWIELHKGELTANWQLAVSGEPPFRIETLKYIMNPRVKSVSALPGYKLLLEFSSGERGQRATCSSTPALLVVMVVD
jgi:hypothetical protein